MPSSSILEQFTPLIREVFENNDLVATADLSASRVTGWDSLANVRLLISIEQAFNIRFSAAEMSGLRNLGELADLVEEVCSALNRP